jgi:hypothetical protein
MGLMIGDSFAVAAARPKPKAKTQFNADELMLPMEQIGPQPRPVNLKNYARIIHVGNGKQDILAGALAAIKDAAPTNRYAILVAAGT